MTETDWNSCTDPHTMLEFLRTSGTASDRKLRLLACACCRSIWGVLHDERSREAVVMTERYADGLATREQIDAARTALAPVEEAADDIAMAASLDAVVEVWQIGEAVRACLLAADSAEFDENRWDVTRDVFSHANNATEPGQRVHQASLVRDIIVNPFRTLPTVNLAWLIWNDGTIRRLASTVYENRCLPEGTLDVDRLAVLADALEEAGCRNQEMLSHCRDGGMHLCGCWAVDLILGKQ